MPTGDQATGLYSELKIEGMPRQALFDRHSVQSAPRARAACLALLLRGPGSLLHGLNLAQPIDAEREGGHCCQLNLAGLLRLYGLLDGHGFLDQLLQYTLIHICQPFDIHASLAGLVLAKLREQGIRTIKVHHAVEHQFRFAR